MTQAFLEQATGVPKNQSAEACHFSDVVLCGAIGLVPMVSDFLTAGFGSSYGQRATGPGPGGRLQRERLCVLLQPTGAASVATSGQAVRPRVHRRQGRDCSSAGRDLDGQSE